MSKLTKDQKRTKAKREEQKRQRAKEHAVNAGVKTLARAIHALTESMLGAASTEKVEESIVNLASGTRPSHRADPFLHPTWRDFKPRLSDLVGMLRTGEMSFGHPISMQGRVYLIDMEKRSYSTVPVPPCMREMARWHPEVVVKKISEELSINPAEGIYCYGLKLGSVAIHFAVVNVGGKDGFTENYLVTPNGWHYLEQHKYELYLEPMLDSARNNSAMTYGLDESEKRMRFHLKATPEDFKIEAILGDEFRRKTLIAMLQESMDESDVILECAHNHHLSHSDKTYNNGWEDGYAERNNELKEAQSALSALKVELQAAKAKAAALPHSQASKPARPLYERMAHLLTPTQA